ncbi:hypothetical protein HF638_05500 [Paenibacillus sp. SZ31]|uniref:nitroreductase n=1 Tax=unclassified Paenibacillus TaxID=185978 RepID=UPI00146EFFBD|nr:nitroreductase [Paenibacillus sp. SZ31]NMI03420.1 hypothetical protein [Paenibacillus sp. SZ31]
MSQSIFQNRHSKRKFHADKPVNRETLESIFKDAINAPSWGNTQPWEVYVATGEKLEELRSAYLKAFEDGEPFQSDIPMPTEWPELFQQRMNQAGEARFSQLGIARGDHEAKAERMKANFQFFDAPVVAFLTLDASLTEWSMHDLGIFSGFLMLSIEAHGLGSLPAYTSISYPKFQREILGIPDDKKIVAGIIFGYPVLEDKDSQVVMPRVALEEVIHFKGN